MERTSDPVLWIKATAYLTVAGVLISLILEGAPFLPWLALGSLIFALLLPMGKGIVLRPPEFSFALLLVDGALVVAGQFLSGHPGTVMILYFVLVSVSARLPRRFSLFAYVLFPLLACLPWLWDEKGRGSWDSITSVVPGFLATIAFSEGFFHQRLLAQENRKLIDELVATQKLLHPEAPPSPSPDSLPLTRRDREVLSLVSMGFSNKEIAQRLYLAEGTVKNRVSGLLEKIGVRDRTQAALMAREMGIL